MLCVVERAPRFLLERCFLPTDPRYGWHGWKPRPDTTWDGAFQPYNAAFQWVRVERIDRYARDIMTSPIEPSVKHHSLDDGNLVGHCLGHEDNHNSRIVAQPDADFTPGGTRRHGAPDPTRSTRGAVDTGTARRPARAGMAGHQARLKSYCGDFVLSDAAYERMREAGGTKL